MRKLSDTLQANNGTAFITVDGSNREFFEMSKIEAFVELTVKEKRMLGSRMTQHKVVGAKGTGSCTMHFMNSDQLKMAIEYINSGKYPNITLQLRNEDPSSSVGASDQLLRGVIFNKFPVAMMEGESEDVLTYDTDFTFDAVDNLQAFNLPEEYR